MRHPDDQDPGMSERFKTRLKRWRDDEKLTQRELGFIADTSETNIRRYENDGTLPGPEIMGRLAVALGRAMDEFTQKAEPPPKPTRPIQSLHYKIRRPSGMADEEWAVYEPKAIKEADLARRRIDVLRDAVSVEQAARRKK